jgi:hypothetical protein
LAMTLIHYFSSRFKNYFIHLERQGYRALHANPRDVRLVKSKSEIILFWTYETCVIVRCNFS